MRTLPNQLFVDGGWRAAAGSPSRLVNPATEEVFAEVHAADAKDVNLAVESAQRAWESGWRDLAPAKREAILHAVARKLRENLEEIAELEMLQIGKPISDARDEAGLGARVFEYYAGAVTKFCGQTIPVGRGGFDFTLRQPMGVVACIVPWNFPFPIGCWKAAPALAAGNCVVLKPASLSPLTALKLGELAHAAGLPPGVLQVLPGSGAAIGDALVTHPLVRKVSFTGSTEVGRRIMELAAAGLKRISLELGGKSPNIVFADSDWERAAESSPMSVFANTGQDCCARSRVFVERSIYDGFVAKFVDATKKLVVGEPAKPETQLGPLVSAGQRASVEGFLADARKCGTRFASGGERPPGKGYYLQPTVLLGVNKSDRCWQEEIFGPVVAITPFDDEAQMIRDVNASPYGLSGSLWTNDLRRAIRVAKAVESGVLSINSHSSVHTEAPFGGFKQSGIGRDLGMAALEGYTEVKNIYVADTEPGAASLAPLKARIKAGEIDTVIVAFPDVFGRFMGKRCTGEFFLDSVASHGTHGCNYLLTVNIEMDPLEGFKVANWEKGFGDFAMQPDLSTWRALPWQPGTALVICDYLHENGQLVNEAPRSMLRRQLDALRQRGLSARMASELEFFLFNNTFHEAYRSEYRSLTPSSDYRIDYQITQPTQDEPLMRALRNQMCAAGVPVETSKGEWGRGQHELNFRYDEPLAMADMHVVFKQGVKEIAAQHGKSVTFMAKPWATEVGSSCHIHVSLWQDGSNLFSPPPQSRGSKAPAQERGSGSKLFRQFLGGLMKYSPELCCFYAPTINAYKRYQAASWAPTKMAWAHDNRTVGFRVVGEGKSFRIENRMPGADANPYLAFAAMLAAGMAGVEEGLDCGHLYQGNAYADPNLPALPKTLREAANLLQASRFARRAFGDDAVDFYVHTARTEADAYDSAVTDWERMRYFERI